MRAYQRRRGWAAYHAGAAGWSSTADLEQMMGIKPPAQARADGAGMAGTAQSLDLAAHNLRLWKAALRHKQTLAEN